MTYSSKRLALIALTWLGLGIVAMAGSPGFGAAADPAGCNETPCAFPAEKHVGGMVLGTTYMNGNAITLFPDKDGDLYSDTSPDSVENQVRTVGLGLNVDEANNFFLYKGWNFDSHLNGGKSRWTYFVMQTDTALIGGSSSCTGRDDCDLYAEVGEVSFSRLESTGTIDLLFGSSFTATTTGYWVVNPENDDECGSTDALLAGNQCLYLVEEGGLADSDLVDIEIEGYDTLIRTHRVESTGTGDQVKVLDARNVYLEMRYGVGDDRAKVTEGVWPDFDGWSYPTTERLGQPNRSAALSNPFFCTGNPDFGSPNCGMDAENLGNARPGYPDIYR